jgi:hypothetical protein
MDVSVYISLTARSQDRIGLHLRIYGSRPMSAGAVDVGRGRSKYRPRQIPAVQPSFICSDGTVENTVADREQWRYYKATPMTNRFSIPYMCNPAIIQYGLQYLCGKGSASVTDWSFCLLRTPISKFSFETDKGQKPCGQAVGLSDVVR